MTSNKASFIRAWGHATISVEATARTAGNLGFDTWVVEDACYTFDKTDYFGARHSAQEVHAMSLGNLHGEYATVVSSRLVLGG